MRDCEQIRRLMEILEEGVSFDQDAFSDVFAMHLTSDMYDCLAAEEEGKIVGVIAVRVERQLHHREPVCQITELVVHPEWRNQGIGTELYHAAEAIACKENCERIELETSTWRRKAHSFYEKKGMCADHYYYTKDLK